MDWKAFFDELTIWLNQANQKFNEPDFWDWAVKSLGEPAIYESKEEALEIANDLGLMAFEIFPMLVTEEEDNDNERA